MASKNPVRRSSAWAVLTMVGLALAGALAPWVCGRHGVFDKWLQIGGGYRPGAFGLHQEGAPETARDERFAGAVFQSQVNPADWYGTYVGGDRFVVELVSTPFLIGSDPIQVPILGYPHRASTKLELEVLDPHGEVEGRMVYEGVNPAEAQGRWRVSTAGWVGRLGRLRLTDHDRSRLGWLAVGRPQSTVSEVTWLIGVPRNYAVYGVATGAVAALLLVPGLVWHTWQRDRRFFIYVPLPGLLALVGLGLLTWQAGTAVGHVAGLIWLLINAAAAALLAWHWWRRGGALTQGESWLLGAYAGAAIGALAFGAMPAEVAQESNMHSTSQARMIASPPDHAVPYCTAVYFLLGKDGRKDRQAYFGDDWSVASRGPLAPLAITATMATFALRPGDPPGGGSDAWPAAKDDGFYLARIMGILTNALVVLGAGMLTASLVPRSTGVIGAAAVAVAPVTVINLDYLWPKLLAAYFILLAIQVLVSGRKVAVVGGLTALAYYSHPVGGLFVPVVGFFIAWTALRSNEGAAPDWRRAVADTARWGAVLAAGILPWLAFKIWLGFPDIFMHYPLGDGRGFAQAVSVSSWLHCRWTNFWTTLVPGAFYAAPYMHRWISGPLSEPLRWAIGYAKTLPEGMGHGWYGAAAYALLMRRQLFPAGFFGVFVAGALGLMLVFWGFSGDGLGRNCLEPLTVLLVVAAVVGLADRPKLLKWLLIATALEAASVRIIGVVFSPTFASVPLNVEVLGTAALALVAMAWPLYYGWRGESLNRPEA